MILTVTFNPAIDHTYILDEDIEYSSISRTDSSQFDAGGKGINVSKYLDALGVENTATGLLGGFTGEYIKKELGEQGLEHDFVEGGRTRINTTILAGDREYKINHDGPETGEEAVDQVIQKIEDRDPETVVVSGSLPPGLDHTAIRRINRETGSEVVVDLSGEVLGELDTGYCLAKPNRTELSEATGKEIESVDDAAEAAGELVERGFKNVLASLGGEGAVLVTREQKMYVEGIEADVEDTTGAGDAILSGMIACMEEGLDKNDALEKALAFATLAVETPGTQTPEIKKLGRYAERAEAEKI